MNVTPIEIYVRNPNVREIRSIKGYLNGTLVFERNVPFSPVKSSWSRLAFPDRQVNKIVFDQGIEIDNFLIVLDSESNLNSNSEDMTDLSDILYQMIDEIIDKKNKFEDE